MDFKILVKELRSFVPVPISKGLLLLKENDGDVEKCVYLFKDKSIKEIQKATNCNQELAAKHYLAEEYDINKAISAIKEELYDLNYKPILDLTLEKLNIVSEWIYLNEDKDFPTSLDYQNVEQTIKTLLLLSSANDFANNIQKALMLKKEIFEGYTDDAPMSEFVRRHQQLDDNAEFQKYYEYCKGKMISLKEEIIRHKRNVIKMTNQ